MRTRTIAAGTMLILLNACEVVRPTVALQRTVSARALLLGASLTRVNRVEDIPTSVREALANLDPDPVVPSGLANPGDPWQCCCTVSSDGPPDRRLLFAFGSPELWAILFEEGGYSVENHFITFSIEPDGRARALESLVLPETPESALDVKRLAANAKTRREFGARRVW
jgi:hypothetical protein